MLDKIFIERAFYSTPPELSKDASEGDIKAAWDDWTKKDAQGRANHKRAHTKAQKAGDLPDSDNDGIMVKIGGVWRQRAGMTAFAGSAEQGTLETVMYEQPTQGRHFQARGKSGGKKSSKQRRGSSKKKEAKRQAILNRFKK